MTSLVATAFPSFSAEVLFRNCFECNTVNYSVFILAVNCFPEIWHQMNQRTLVLPCGPLTVMTSMVQEIQHTRINQKDVGLVHYFGPGAFESH